LSRLARRELPINPDQAGQLIEDASTGERLYKRGKSMYIGLGTIIVIVIIVLIILMLRRR